MSNERGSRRIDEHERRPELRACAFGDFPVGDATTGADDANVGGTAGSIAPMTRGATAPGVEGAKPEASPGMSEIFYKSLFASRAPSFELHPDRLFHGVGHFGRARSGGRAFKRRGNHAETVESPKCKSWSQLQNLSEDNQLFETKRTQSRRHLETITQMYHGQADDTNYFLHEHSRGAVLRGAARPRDFEERDGAHWIRNNLCATGFTEKGYSRGR